MSLTVSQEICLDVLSAPAEGTTNANEESAIQGAHHANAAQDEPEEYPARSRVILVVIALALVTFIVGMDQTIIATALPYITDDFGALDQVGWYASSYLMASCLCQLVWGKAYKFFKLKQSFLLAVLIFEIGSILCAAAPSSAVFIAGRAVAGVGSAGINAGYGVILTRLVPLRTRAIYDTWLGAVFSVASVSAPLIGGVLTSKVSWRWCFWINLPCGVVSAFAVFIFVKVKQGHTQHELPISTKLKEFDIPGTVVLLGGMTCLLLALQWGGIVYSWSSAVSIALFVLFGALLLLFVPMQWRARDSALVPLRILKERNISATTIYHVLLGGAIAIYEYYLPIWFQAIKGATPLHSGIMLLPMIISNLIASLLVGSLISWTGYPYPFLLLGAGIFTIGSGVTVTFHPNTSRVRWIILQILIGAGPGFGLQAALMPPQILLSDKDVSTGLAIENFGFVLGGALFIPIAQAVFLNHLALTLANLLKSNPSDTSTTASLSSAGVTQVLAHIQAKDKAKALIAYNDAVVLTFWIATGLGIAAFLVGVVVKPLLSVKKKQQ